MRIGLLGGSFNPAHDGHIQLSLEALKRLRLDQVWWLVSPQNPLKTSKNMAPLTKRLQEASVFVTHPRIKVTALEETLGTRYTYDTLLALTERFPEHDFIWLMGSDNLQQFDQWYRWQEIPLLMPMAVFHRVPYSIRALRSKAACVLRPYRIPADHAGELASTPLPAWSFIPMVPVMTSSTILREASS